MNAQSELAAAEAELEKQRALNDKLENDLLQLETHNPKGTNGDAAPADSDVLAGLDLGKKPAVRFQFLLAFLRASRADVDYCSLHRQGIVLYHLLQRLIRRFCPS